MLPYRFLSYSILYKFVILLFTVQVLNCGLALGYQAEEEAAQASEKNSNNNPILAALGLSSDGSGPVGGGASSVVSFSPSIISFTAASGKTTYSLTIPTWPLAGSGQIDLAGVWVPKTASCADPSPNTVSMVSDSTYPISRSGITFSCNNVGTGSIQYIVTSSFGTGAPAPDTIMGTLNITITP